MKAWITKYALTQGIIEKEGKISETFKTFTVDRNEFGCSEFYNQSQWRKTREEAIERAKEMRSAKIRALLRQITKTQSITFK